MDLSKNNSFSRQEAINYIPHTEKRKKVTACENTKTNKCGRVVLFCKSVYFGISELILYFQYFFHVLHVFS